MTWQWFKDRLRLTFRWRLDDWGTFGWILGDFNLAFQSVLNAASVGSKILWWWINHNVTSYSNNYVCNYFLYLRDPSEELVEVGFPFSHFRSRETFRHTFSTETLALCSFKSRVIISRDSRETFDSVKLPLMHWNLKNTWRDYFYIFYSAVEQQR